MLEMTWKRDDLEKGRQESSEKTNKEIARKILSKSMSPEDVSEITGVPIEDVIGLSYENKNTASN